MLLVHLAIPREKAEAGTGKRIMLKGPFAKLLKRERWCEQRRAAAVRTPHPALSGVPAVAENEKNGGRNLAQGTDAALAQTLMVDGSAVAHASMPPK